MTLYVNTIVEATYAGNSSTRPGLVTARLTDNAHIAAPSKRDLEPSLPILHTTFPAPLLPYLPPCSPRAPHPCQMRKRAARDSSLAASPCVECARRFDAQGPARGHSSAASRTS